MNYQAGDTTMDEAINLLEQAQELIAGDTRSGAIEWQEAVDNFIKQYD